MTIEQKIPENLLDDKGQRFMKLYTVVQARIYGFVLALVPYWSDVDDIVQETASVMWSKFDHYQPGTDFMAWALTIARYQVLSYRQRTKNRQKHFSAEALEILCETIQSREYKKNLEEETLRHCLDQLSNRDRHILQLRYEVGATMKCLAQRIDMNINTLYKLLNRIHAALLHCIKKKDFC